MDYSEITVFTNSESAELVAYFLSEVCMDGVGIYDRNDFLSASWDYKDDGAEKAYTEEVQVKGYCGKEDTESVLCFLKEKFECLTQAGSLKISLSTVEGDAWVKSWKETFRPIETEKLVVCPEWLTVETDKKVLLLDTGIAFGTGQHETTSMCIEFAEELALENKSVLDVGCGSGILGLSSLLLGAKKAVLIDIDAQAAEIACHNAEINGLIGRCEIYAGNLTEKAQGVFDVVFANLTADILKLLYVNIEEKVKKDSLLVLSGILDVKAEETESLYFERFETIGRKAKGEWRALLLKARS